MKGNQPQESCGKVGGKDVLGRGNSKVKGPEAGLRPLNIAKSRKAWEEWKSKWSAGA